MTRGQKPATIGKRDQRLLATVGDAALGMAHELGNLLGALQLRMQILDQNPACRQVQGKNLDAMGRILSEASALVQQVQALGMSSSDVVSKDDGSQAVDLHQTVTEAIRLAGNGMRLQARKAGVDLRIEQALGRLPRVHGVPAEIRRTLVDLLIDARDALPRGGTIRVVGKRTANAVTLRIEDQRGKLAARTPTPTRARRELRLPVSRGRTGARSRS
jgi:signal transduction histidine kinase